jgi:putative ABC transport system permease protein
MPPLPEGIRVAIDLSPDWRVFVFAVAFSTLTGILFGLAPALRGSRTDVAPVLKDDASAIAGGHRQSRSRMVLVVTQVSLSVLMLVCAGLVLRSLDNLRPTRLGFSSDQLLVVPVALEESAHDRRSSQAFYRQLTERVLALPGVQHVSLVQGIPGGFLGNTRRSTEVEGYSPGPDERMDIENAFVGPHYFSNMNVPVVSGRDIDERDREGAPCAAVINEAFARRFFSSASSPLGKHVAKFEGDAAKQWCEVVGVIRDDRFQALEKTPKPFFALAVYQSHRLGMSMLVTTATDPGPMAAPVARIVRDLEPAMPVQDIRTLADTFSAALYPFRLLAIVLGACGGRHLRHRVVFGCAADSRSRHPNGAGRAEVRCAQAGCRPGHDRRRRRAGHRPPD